MADKKRVVIVGAGFAGLNAAKILGRDSRVEISFLDRRNYHLFQPLLYQVAMAALSPAEIAVPIRSMVSKYSNTDVILGNVESISVSEKKVHGDFGVIPYDYLILACGAKHSYFNHPEWETFAPGLKTLEQATEIRRRVLLAFEKAEHEKDPEEKKRLLTFVIVGGGPTGVELAGAIGEISRYTLSEDFRHIDPARTRVILLEAGSRILPSFSEKLSQKATRDLEHLGVQAWTGYRVTQVDDEGVLIDGKERIRAATVLWAAGVQPSSLNKTLGESLDRSGRVMIQKDLSLAQHREVFVLGDQACFTVDASGKSLPGLAPVAMQQGRHAARNILADLDQAERKEFVYLDKGQMATIGRKKAVLQMGALQLSGFLAWAAWLLIHIYYLIGFKNRVFVLIQWGWSYLSFKRGARLIVNKEWRSVPLSDPSQPRAQTNS